ncbi:hypothetical protein Pint_33434 [Pistacia integerrima]|uniref:Uncharacterized protein n=1 Tax=Pistacia integerrima TaxID=434235 RepID=A0ACC0X5N8_9ROSI|nr:hypothetical protein Pint_33434 [Pistacia integerrima]
MNETKDQPTPMRRSLKLEADEGGKNVDTKLYRTMICSLLYLIASRTDILFSVCMCACFHSCPKESHLNAVKRILRYLKGTPNIGLWYPKGSSFSLIGYSDDDFRGCRIDRKSTSGTCQFLRSMLVSWFSKRQNSIVASTMKAKYVLAGNCFAQLLWMKQQLEDFGYIMHCVPIHYDNTSAINLSKNLVYHSRTIG